MYFTPTARLTTNGRMTVARTILKDGEFVDTTYEHKDTLFRIMKPEEKSKVKDFMLDNFYTNAIVPSAMGANISRMLSEVSVLRFLRFFLAKKKVSSRNRTRDRWHASQVSCPTYHESLLQ